MGVSGWEDHGVPQGLHGACMVVLHETVVACATPEAMKAVRRAVRLASTRWTEAWAQLLALHEPEPSAWMPE
jgi:hypothetical protein